MLLISISQTRELRPRGRRHSPTPSLPSYDLAFIHFHELSASGVPGAALASGSEADENPSSPGAGILPAFGDFLGRCKRAEHVGESPRLEGRV